MGRFLRDQGVEARFGENRLRNPSHGACCLDYRVYSYVVCGAWHILVCDIYDITATRRCYCRGCDVYNITLYDMIYICRCDIVLICMRYDICAVDVAALLISYHMCKAYHIT